MGLIEGGKESRRQPIVIQKTGGLQKYSRPWFETPTMRAKSRTFSQPHSFLFSLAKGKRFVNRSQRFIRRHACRRVGEGVMHLLATHNKSLLHAYLGQGSWDFMLARKQRRLCLDMGDIVSCCHGVSFRC